MSVHPAKTPQKLILKRQNQDVSFSSGARLT